MPEGDGGVLEGVLHVDESGFSAVDGYPDHVEAECCLLGLSNGEVVPGEGAYFGLFARGYRFERVAEVGTLAQLDLDEDEGIVLAQYQVELTVAGAVVPLDERVTAVLKVLQGEVLAPAPGGATLQGPTPA